jgi:hypothetical protein
MALDVIGVGLGRTGTLSLKVALEMLGFRPCYHMVEVWANPPCMSDWVAAANGRADWEKLFAGYKATVDYPGCHFWRELIAAYPQAKVVLTVREPRSWFESTQTTIFSPRMRERVGASPARDFLDKTVWNTFGSDIHDRDYMVAAFERHTEEVQRAIPRDRLLTFDVAQGWQPLCQFLDVPVPGKPFPRLNSREELSAKVAAARANGAEQDLVASAKAYVAGLRKLSEGV